MVKHVAYDCPGKNEERADWAESAVDHWAAMVEPNEDRDTILQDFLACLRHYADRYGLDFDGISRGAKRSYKMDRTRGEIGSSEPAMRWPDPA